MNQKQMIEKFQCPGCVCGSDTECGSYKPVAVYDTSFRCDGHVIGLSVLGGPHIALGMPKGFNRTLEGNKLPFRLWLNGTGPKYDKFNVPVWATETGGCLFVRGMSPRLNRTFLDVIEGGRMSKICPEATDAATFLDDMD